MTPAKYNFICPQGATLSRTLTWSIDDVAVNLTGYTAKMQVREKYSSNAYVLQVLSDDYAPATTGIFLGGSAGTIQLYLTDEATNLVPATYVYDLELYSNDETYRLIEGRFIVTPAVTR